MAKNRQTPHPQGQNAADGTREYRLHSASGASGRRDQNTTWRPEDDGPAGLGALNASVFQGLQDQAFYPGMAFSGEVFRTGEDGRPRLEDSVVRQEVKTREEFPYG